MRNLQYGSLSPTRTYTAHPNYCEYTTSITLAVTVDQAKAELPVYDTQSDAQIQRKIFAVQTMIERYINRDATPRTRIAYWSLPQEVIYLPYGPHLSTITVKQRPSSRDDYETKTVDEDYWIVDDTLQFKAIELSKQQPTQVTFISGPGSVSEQLQEAILQEVSFQFKNRNDPDLEPPEMVGGISRVTYNMIKNLIRH